MKTLKYISLALALLVCVSTNAAKRVKKSKKKAVAEKVDTIPMADFSYAYGIAQTNGLKNYLAQRMGVEEAYMPDFLAGFDKAELDEADKRLIASGNLERILSEERL